MENRYFMNDFDLRLFFFHCLVYVSISAFKMSIKSTDYAYVFGDSSYSAIFSSKKSVLFENLIVCLNIFFPHYMGPKTPIKNVSHVFSRLQNIDLWYSMKKYTYIWYYKITSLIPSYSGTTYSLFRNKRFALNLMT